MPNSLALYERLPVLLQNLACSAVGWHDYRIRHGRTFQSALKSLLESERLPGAELVALQEERLQAIVAHAYQTVPYYRELMRDSRLVPGDIRTTADLPKLPILTKELVRANVHQLQSTSVRG